jgi:hypothetical protein
MERLDEATTGLIEQEAKEHFPEGAVRDVAVVQYGDDPAVEPGEVGIRMTIASPAGIEPDGEFLDFFKSTYREAFARLRGDIRQRFPDTTRIEIISGTDPRNRFVTLLKPDECDPAGDLTPVTARFGPADLETLDTLISVGIAASRAEAIRWVVAHVRERPAYARLRERAPEIEEIKSQL